MRPSNIWVGGFSKHGVKLKLRSIEDIFRHPKKVKISIMDHPQNTLRNLVNVYLCAWNDQNQTPITAQGKGLDKVKVKVKDLVNLRTIGSSRVTYPVQRPFIFTVWNKPLP